MPPSGARPAPPAGNGAAAQARATKLMHLPPEARLPGAVSRPPARTEVMNVRGPTVDPAPPKSLVTAPPAAQPAPKPAPVEDLGRAKTIAMSAREIADLPPDIVVDPPSVDPPSAAPASARPGAMAAKGTLFDSTLSVPTMPNWDEEPAAAAKVAETKAAETSGAVAAKTTAAVAAKATAVDVAQTLVQPSPPGPPPEPAPKPAAPAKFTAAATLNQPRTGSAPIPAPAASSNKSGPQPTLFGLQPNLTGPGSVMTGTTPTSAKVDPPAQPPSPKSGPQDTLYGIHPDLEAAKPAISAAAQTLVHPPAQASVPAAATAPPSSSIVVGDVAPDAAAPTAVPFETDVPLAVAAEKSQPESWVTPPRTSGESGGMRARSRSQSGAPSTPASPIDSSGRDARTSLPSWAALPSASDMRRPSAAFTAFDGPRMNFVALLRKTGLFYWSNLVPLLIMAATVLGPISLLTSGIATGLTRNGPILLAGVAMLLTFLIFLLMMGVAWPITSGAISLSVMHRLQGGRIEPWREYGLCLKRLVPLALAVLPASVAIGIGYILFIIPGLVASLFFALVPTVVLLEGRTGIEALKRSALVMKDVVGRALGLLAVFVVLSLLVRKLVTLVIPGTGFFDLFAGDVTMILLAPLPMIALTMLYIEYRHEHEGLTPETLQNELDTLSG